MNESPRFIFLDLETTGLESMVDQITEAAWITDDGIEAQFFVEHTQLPNDWVLHNTDYLERIAKASKITAGTLLFELTQTCDRLSAESKGNVYIVGACPAFDDRFLRMAYRMALRQVPYHYHVIDVEAMALGKFPNLKEPCSLKDLRSLLGIAGENEAAHTALADAREVKLIFEKLRSLHCGDCDV